MTIKVSIALPVATRHVRDMTEKMLKATLNPNKHQQNQLLRLASLELMATRIVRIVFTRKRGLARTFFVMA